MSVRVTLPSDQQEFLYYRVLQSQALKRISKKISPRLGETEAALVGIVGEAAWANFLGVDYDFTPLIGGDGGKGDLVLPSGSTISVRTTRIPGFGWALRSTAKEDLQDDYVTLTLVSTPWDEIHLIGWATREEFNTLATLERRDGPGPYRKDQWVLHERHLHAPGSFPNSGQRRVRDRDGRKSGRGHDCNNDQDGSLD